MSNGNPFDRIATRDGDAWIAVGVVNFDDISTTLANWLADCGA